MAARFSFWLDEILWSQGRVAVELIEELLQDMAGHRAGGPLKAPSLHPAAVAAAAAAAAAATGASSSDAGPQLTITPLDINNPQQQQQMMDDSDVTESSAAAAAEAAAGPAAAPPAAELPEEAYLGRATRSDEHLLGYCHVQRWHLLWTKSVYGIKAARRMQPGQVVSAIAGLNSLTMKKKMIITLKMGLGNAAFDIIPLTFCIPEELGAWAAWLDAHPGADTGLWMLKTGQDAGKGLRLVPTSKALQAALLPPRNASKPHMHLKVAQQYITRPLLLEGRKFHLRLWLLVTGHTPLRAYLHTSGLVLFSSEPYNPDAPLAGGLRPSTSHVTNYARNEDTMVWTLQQLEQHMGGTAWATLWSKMERASALTIAAAYQPLLKAHQWLASPVEDYGFQMVGLDYMIDEDMAPWLLEVNSAPSIMAVHSEADMQVLIKQQKQAMLRDMLQMVQHRFLDPQGVPYIRTCSSCSEPQADPTSAAAAGLEGARPHLFWQQHLAAELAQRGGFQPLMHLFPLDSGRIPWQPSDWELRKALQPQQRGS